MTDRSRLSADEIGRALSGLPTWRFDRDRLVRAYEFGTFPRALAFLAGAGAEAQTLNHHPNWRNVYGTVEVELWTHDRGGVTRLDLELARRMEALALRLLETDAPGA